MEYLLYVCVSHEYRQKLTAADVISIFLQLHAFIHLCIRKLLEISCLFFHIGSFFLDLCYREDRKTDTLI